ncbi:MAG: hypothetical protein MMC23_006482 [Stictis urceolatum]|nr:hypothetical protein [Stictis urceolata]
MVLVERADDSRAVVARDQSLVEVDDVVERPELEPGRTYVQRRPGRNVFIRKRERPYGLTSVHLYLKFLLAIHRCHSRHTSSLLDPMGKFIPVLRVENTGLPATMLSILSCQVRYRGPVIVDPA